MSEGHEPSFHHVPVLLDEVVAAFGPVAPGWIIDGTVGGAGHAEALLVAHDHLSVLGIDRDPAAVETARRRLERFGSRAVVIHSRFDGLGNIMRLLRSRSDRNADRFDGLDIPDGVEGPVTGVLLDLGVSSTQLDRGDRGFSYRHGGPLDMRMDPTSGPSAADLVNTAEARELERIIRRFGDERHARRIAAAIVAARPVADTAQLAQIVREAIPAAARRSGGHPATRTFQALRIEVNDELGQLETVLGDALDLLVPGGRVAVITYHSGEDRIVARRFRDAAADDCVCPPGTGDCRCGGSPSVTLIPRRAVTASEDEIEANPRSRSARLRVVEQLEAV